MADWSLSDISEKMRDIDFAMLSTLTDGGKIAARPMSNNRDVDYDGDSYYFTTDDTRMVADIGRNANVGLSFHGHSGILGQKPVMIAVEGMASLIRDKAAFAEHWTSDLDAWFEQGVDTPGLVLIKVHAERIHYWAGEDEGELLVEARS